MARRLAGAVILFSALVMHHDSMAQGTIPVERMPSKSVSVSHASARVEGQTLMVTGKASRWHEVHFPGHVDVTVYGPDGNVVAVDHARLPQIMSKRGGRLELPFSASFGFIPPQGSIIRVQYHPSARCKNTAM